MTVYLLVEQPAGTPVGIFESHEEAREYGFNNLKSSFFSVYAHKTPLILDEVVRKRCVEYVAEGKFVFTTCDE